MADSYIRWTFDDLSNNLEEITPRIRRAMAIAGRVTATRGQNWMRSNARWTDRTGNARNGLVGVHEAVGRDTDIVTFAHSVPYGIWLEVRFAGRYAVILPAVEHWGPKAMEHVVRLAFRRTT